MKLKDIYFWKISLFVRVVREW